MPFEAPPHTAYYRLDPYNTPTDEHGQPIGGGPWLRTGEVDDGLAGRRNDTDDKLSITCPSDEFPASQGKVPLYVTRATEGNVQTVREAGFQRGNIAVPFTHGNQPHRDDLHAQQFYEEADKAHKFQTKSNFINILHLTPVTGAQFTEKDSAEVVTWPQFAEPAFFDTFNRQRNVLTIVDQDGNQYIAQDDQDLRKKLKENGFRHNPGLPVPFANYETPVITQPPSLVGLPHMDLQRVVGGLQSSSVYRWAAPVVPIL